MNQNSAHIDQEHCRNLFVKKNLFKLKDFHGQMTQTFQYNKNKNYILKWFAFYGKENGLKIQSLNLKKRNTDGTA